MGRFFKRSLDGGQPRAQPHLGKAKPNVLNTVFSPRLATVYQVIDPRGHTRSRLK